MAPARRKGSTPSKAPTPTAKEAGDGRGEGSSGGGGSTSSKPPPLSLLLVGVGSVAVGIGGVVASRAMYARSTAASVEPAGADPGGQGGQSRAAENLMRRLRDESGGASQASYRPADFDPVRAAREFGLVELMDSITREYPGARYVSKDPPIILIDDFVTDEECEHIIKIGTPGLEVSTGTGAYKNGKFTRMKMESRTSYNSWLMNGLERDSVVKRVDRRIANVTGLYDGNSEHYQVRLHWEDRSSPGTPPPPAPPPSSPAPGRGAPTAAGGLVATHPPLRCLSTAALTSPQPAATLVLPWQVLRYLPPDQFYKSVRRPLGPFWRPL
jgi:hypothetical protein